MRWLHTGGIYAALSEQACETVIAACKAAKKYGTVVSYDLNYRPSMWSAIGGLDKAREVNREVAKYVDVMIGNEEDFTPASASRSRATTQTSKSSTSTATRR